MIIDTEIELDIQILQIKSYSKSELKEIINWLQNCSVEESIMSIMSVSIVRSIRYQSIKSFDIFLFYRKWI